MISNLLNEDQVAKYNKLHCEAVPKDETDYKHLLKSIFLSDSLMSFIESHPLPKEIINNLKDENEISESHLTMQLSSTLVEVKYELGNKVNIINDQFINFGKYYNNENQNEIISRIIENKEKDIYQFYRETIKDGDSFYRSFIFSYLEKHIANKNIIEIKKIILELLQNSDCFEYNNINYDKNETIYILYKIIDTIEHESEVEALVILNKAFALNLKFSGELVKYMKKKISIYLSRHVKEFNSDKLIKTKLISRFYFNKDDQTFNCRDYCKYKLEIMETEPDAFNIQISVLPFNCKEINIYYTENFGRTKGVLKIKNHALISAIKRPPVTINLIYNWTKSYSIAYLKEDNKNIIQKYLSYNSNNENPCIILKIKKLNPLNKKTFSVILEKHSCETCNSDSKLVSIEGFNQGFCLSCLTSTINSVLESRFQFLKEDNFDYVEYYTRPIELFISKNKSYYLTEKNIKDITKNSIYGNINLLLKPKCDNCKQKFSYTKEFIALPCGCRFCKDCLENASPESLDFVYINQFERFKLNYGNFMCCCKTKYNLDDFNNFLDYEKDKSDLLITKSKIRMIEYIRTYCMRCGIKLQSLVYEIRNNFDNRFGDDLTDFELKSNNNISMSNDFVLIDLNEEGNKNSRVKQNINDSSQRLDKQNSLSDNFYNKMIHFMCRKCYFEITDSKNYENEHNIYCAICYCTHKFNLKKGLLNQSNYSDINIKNCNIY